MNKQLAFYKDVSELFTQEEIEKIVADDAKWYGHYAETVWLTPYHDLKRKSRMTHIPSITSVLSDIPPSRTNEFTSKTEDYALKSVQAKQMLDFFHECLESLPGELRLLIQKKHLERRSDGRFYADAIVYDLLGLSRASYYRMKKQALFELGELLFLYELEKRNERSG